MGREQEEVWNPEPVDGGWIQCEKLTLSPDGKKLAFAGAGTWTAGKTPAFPCLNRTRESG